MNKEPLTTWAETAIIAGRLVTNVEKRKVGFIPKTVKVKIQIVRKDVGGEENYEIFKAVGDFLGVEGNRTGMGELFVQRSISLTCQKPFVFAWKFHGLSNWNHLSLNVIWIWISNRANFVTRSKIISRNPSLFRWSRIPWSGNTECFYNEAGVRQTIITHHNAKHWCKCFVSNWLPWNVWSLVGWNVYEISGSSVTKSGCYTTLNLLRSKSNTWLPISWT